jgi:hypothetical protein
MQLEPSDDEREALARFLRSGIDADRYPLSPRLAPLKGDFGEAGPTTPGVAGSAAEGWNAEPVMARMVEINAEMASSNRRQLSSSMSFSLCSTQFSNSFNNCSRNSRAVNGAE